MSIVGGQPVGVFDSGIGGLSVLKHIHNILPQEKLVYIADSAFAPYGERNQEYILQRCMVLTEFLVQQGAKAVVVACNTATAAAVQALRKQFAIPIVAIEPAVKPAVLQSKSRVVAILATTETLRSERFLRLKELYDEHAQILLQPCPGLVELIEQGAIDSPELESLLMNFIQPALAQGADTLVLGCTHYPFVAPLIQRLAGASVHIIDAGLPVARELARQLRAQGLSNQEFVAVDSQKAHLSFWSSLSPLDAAKMISHIWGGQQTVCQLPEHLL